MPRGERPKRARNEPEVNGVSNRGPEDSDGEDNEGVNGVSLENLDPQQRAEDQRQRRAIRQEYRNLIERTQENSHDLARSDNEGLLETIRVANQVFDKVKNTREAVLDSHLMAVVGDIARQKAQAFNTNLVTFEPVEYAIKIMSFLTDDTLSEEVAISSEGWEKLGEAVQAFFRRAPPLHLMFGTFRRQPPEKKAETTRRPRQKDNEANAKKTVPEQLKSFREAEKTNSEATTEQVEKIHDHLKKYCYEQNNGDPLCYFEFVVNPESFGQTIENMFYVSFLIKDGFAKIILDADGLPLIVPIENPQSEAERASNLKNKQVVMTLTKQEWEQIVETFDIQEPLIPTR